MAIKKSKAAKVPKKNMTKLVVATKSPRTGAYTFPEKMITLDKLNEELAKHKK